MFLYFILPLATYFDPVPKAVAIARPAVDTAVRAVASLSIKVIDISTVVTAAAIRVPFTDPCVSVIMFPVSNTLKSEML